MFGDMLKGIMTFIFENKWKEWLKEEVNEHTKTIQQMNTNKNNK
tara:strand:- start:6250 stop:6381 length:132 start_codon:yes stop_codon:yes gene_type:complete